MEHTISLDQILNDSLWVIKMISGARYVGTRKDIKEYKARGEWRDCDTLCTEGQPEELQPFWRAYWKYADVHGFITIQDFYAIWEE